MTITRNNENLTKKFSTVGTELFCLQILTLSFFHSAPADKAVNIIDKKSNEADNNRNILHIFHACENPHDNQNDIVCSICHGEIRASSEGEINCNEACCDRQCAGNEVGCVEIFKTEITPKGDNKCEKAHENDLFFAD